MNRETWAIKDKLIYDFCTRSPSSSLALTGVATLLFFFPLTADPDWILGSRIIAAIAFIFCLYRWHHAKQIVKASSKEQFFKQFQVHALLVNFTSLIMGILLTIGVISADLTTNPSLLLTTFILISGLAAASASSTALAPRLQFTHLLFTAVLPSFSFLFYSADNGFVVKLIPFLMIIFTGYLLGSSRQFYKSMMSRYEIEAALRVEQLNLLEAIGDLKLAQAEALKQKANAEYSSKMASLGQMAGGIAHEVNNPLAVIRASIDLIDRQIQSNNPDFSQMHKWVGKIQNTTDRIASIIKGLLSFSRSGREDPFVLFNLKNALEDTLQFCRERFRHAGIDLQVQAFADIEVEGRQVQLSQVFLNLLNNAFDAVEKQPNAWIRVKIQDLGLQVEVSVEDSGPGVASGIQDMVFQPFFTTKEIGKGTGLGLSISKGIIENHGGHLMLDLTNHHTRFCYQIPKRQSLRAPELSQN
ncbi:MAG: sensor histidine kinase [Pseudobdellovibrionaceae bacterium]